MCLHLVGYSAAAFGQTQQYILVAWVKFVLGLSSAASVVVSSVVDDAVTAAYAGRRLLQTGACYVSLTLAAASGNATDAAAVNGAIATLASALSTGSAGLTGLQTALPALTAATVATAPPPSTPPYPYSYAPTDVGTSSGGVSTAVVAGAAGGGGGGAVAAVVLFVVYRRWRAQGREVAPAPAPAPAPKPAPAPSGGGEAVQYAIPLPPGCDYHVFLSHNWGDKDPVTGRFDNHVRVARVNAALKARGLATWFDDDCMVGQIADQMSSGIQRSATVAVFITQAYLEKVNGDDPKDNCKKEFRFATQKKAGRLIAVPMEAACESPDHWGNVGHGTVGLELGASRPGARRAARCSAPRRCPTCRARPLSFVLRRCTVHPAPLPCDVCRMLCRPPHVLQGDFCTERSLPRRTTTGRRLSRT